MQKLKRFLPILLMVGVIALTMVPTVLADTGGPQGGSNSGTTKPPPPPPSGGTLLDYLIWLVMVLFGLY
jgi:hypothetical protein